jgi:hypothetical protein
MFNRIDPTLRLELLPMLRHDALERFLKMPILKKVRIKLQRATDTSFLKELPLSETDRITFLGMLESPYVDLTLSVGRKKEKLGNRWREFASAIARLYRNGKTDSIDALQISGKADDNCKTEILDLLEGRLTYETEIDLENNVRTLDQSRLMLAGISALQEKHEELASLCGVR